MTPQKPVHDPFFQRRTTVLTALGVSLVSAFSFFLLYGQGFFTFFTVSYFSLVMLIDLMRLKRKESYINPTQLLLEQGVSVSDFERYLVSKRRYRVVAIAVGFVSGIIAAKIGGSFPLYVWAGCFGGWCFYPLVRKIYLRIPGPKLITHNTNIDLDYGPYNPAEYISRSDHNGAYSPSVYINDSLSSNPNGPYSWILGTVAYNLNVHPPVIKSSHF
ncbi:MAG: hypothetical protein C0514_08065 [Candidatus Puniceispirillum sp.]|nr:hypothetical protein [Candidatus Puniceispirillum sp.]